MYVFATQVLTKFVRRPYTQILGARLEFSEQQIYQLNRP
jgi:hypothetical protein